MSIRSMERGWSDFVLEGCRYVHVFRLLELPSRSASDRASVSRASVHHRYQHLDLPALPIPNNDGNEERIHALSVKNIDV